MSFVLNKKKHVWVFIGFNLPFLTIREMVILLTCSLFATSFVHKYIMFKIAQKKPLQNYIKKNIKIFVQNK